MTVWKLGGDGSRLPAPSSRGPAIDLPFDYVDFKGPCADCGTDCLDEWDRMFERKFSSGFLVEQDPSHKDPEGALLEQLLFEKGKWPQYSTKGHTYGKTGEFTVIPMSSEVKVGDIRVAYTDHWITDDPEEGAVRTFMKRPEEYWAEKALPYGQRGKMPDDEWKEHRDKIDEARLEWIRCRHTHTDHTHVKTLNGPGVGQPNGFPINIDDCITGIWDYNLVDTSTTIEKFGIYEAVHFYEIFPACGSKSQTSPPFGSSAPLIHVLNYQPQPDSMHDHANCGSQKHNELYEDGDWFYFMGDEPGHRQPCSCDGKRSQYGKTVMGITSPWCDHTLARYSKSPHRIGIGHADTSGLSPRGANAPLYDNEGEAKTFGAICETFLFKVGEFYKTTVRHFGSTLESFQAPSGAAKELWTFKHPEEGGDGPESVYGSEIGGGCWCTNPFKDPLGDLTQQWQTKYCAKMLLQLPCIRPLDCSQVIPAEHVEDFEQDGDGVQCCENFDPKYCEEQLEHIYFDEVSLLAAFKRDARYQGADFSKNNSRPRIHQEGDPIRCQASQIYGWVWLLQPCEGFGQDKWERMYDLPGPFQANCIAAGEDCKCSLKPGPPPNTNLKANLGTEVSVASAWKSDYAVVVSLLWGLDGVDLGTSCAWKQKDYGFSHCGQDDAFLVQLDFFEGGFKNRDSGEIEMTKITSSKLHPPKTIPKKNPIVDGVVIETPWSEGGMHDDLGTSIAAWTNFNGSKDEMPNGEFKQVGEKGQQLYRFQTDFEAAEVFYKAAGAQYWYDGIAKNGKQLVGTFGELGATPGTADYLATDVMFQFAAGAQNSDDFTGQGQPPLNADSPCGTPERVNARTMSGEFVAGQNPDGTNICAINDPVDGCNDVETRIFTGHGDPAPRFDEKQRINYYGECTQAVDELSALTKNLASCVGVSVDNCENLYFVHKPYIKLKNEFYDDEAGFFVCGIPLGKVDRSIIGTKGAGDNVHDYCDHPSRGILAFSDDNLDPNFQGNNPLTPLQKCNIAGGQFKRTDFGAPEFSICGTTFTDIGIVYADGNTYCGLRPAINANGDERYSPVSCSSCEKYTCQKRPDVYNIPFGLGNRGYKSCDSVHCCQWLVNNPHYDPAGMHNAFGHGKISNVTCDTHVPWCAVPAYVAGHAHKPFDTGFVWHTVLGWHPGTALDRGVFEYRFRCKEDGGDTQFMAEGEDNHIFDCCDVSSTENVPCNVITVPKQYEAPVFYVVDPAVPSVSLA